MVDQYVLILPMGTALGSWRWEFVDGPSEHLFQQTIFDFLSGCSLLQTHISIATLVVHVAYVYTGFVKTLFRELYSCYFVYLPCFSYRLLPREMLMQFESVLRKLSVTNYAVVHAC